jgi:hypothetical protein
LWDGMTGKRIVAILEKVLPAANLSIR